MARMADPIPTVSPAPAANRPDAARIAAEILRQVEARGAERSICPSEVARALEGGAGTDGTAAGAWQRLMPPVRQAARDLAREGRIDILRKGKPVDPAVEPRGVIRLRLRRTPT